MSLFHNITVTVYSFVVYTYLIVSVDCIGFDHTFYYFIFSYSAIFAASMSINIIQYSIYNTRLARPILHQDPFFWSQTGLVLRQTVSDHITAVK